MLGDAEHIAHLRDVAERTTAALGGLNSSGGAPDRRYDAMARVVDAERELCRKGELLEQKTQEIREFLQLLPRADAATVLWLRYISRLSMEKIAEKMFICDRHARRLHVQGMEAAERMMNNGTD